MPTRRREPGTSSIPARHLAAGHQDSGREPRGVPTRKYMADQILGYIGVDVLNNATVCNEASALLRAGLPMQVVSVYPHRKAAYYEDASLGPLLGSIEDLFPLRA